MLPGVLECDRRRTQPPRRLVHEHSARLGDRLHPGGGVHRVPGDHALRRGPHRHRDLTGDHPDPHRQPRDTQVSSPRAVTVATRSRPARTARSASSSCATGTPHTAITASPMNFSTAPLYRPITTRHCPKYALSNSRTSSASLDADNGVNPTRSANNTDVTRRSATGPAAEPEVEKGDPVLTVDEALEDSAAPHSPQKLPLSSGAPQDGHENNTAVSLAQTGASVVIIDADMRRPRLRSIFGLSDRAGLSSVLSSELSDAEVLAMVSKEEVTGLHVLTAGPIPPNPAELLGSDQMRRLIATLQANFNHVVIDSPPVSSFTDGVLISTIVDGVLLVVHGGKSSRHVVKRSRQLLQDVGAKIFGVVLNNVNLQSHDYYYYQRYYGSSYYKADPEEEMESAAAAPSSLDLR